MVGKLRLAGTGCILMLALSSCQVLFIGAFPPSASQATARSDLSTAIAQSPAASFNLKRVNAGGKEYFLLFSSLAFDPAQAHVMVLDDSLHILNTYTSNDLGGPPSNPNAMTDVNGNVIIGNLLFTPQPSGLAPAGSAPAGIMGPSVTGLPSFTRNEIDFNTNGGNLTWVEYDATWALIGELGPVPLGGPSSLFLGDVLTERDSAGMPDVFILRGNNNATYLLLIPKDLIDASGNLAAAIGGSTIFAVFQPLNLIVQKSNLENSIGLAYGEVFAYDNSSQSLIHFSLGSPGSVNSLPMKWNHGSQLAAGASGTFCVVWDPSTRTVARYDQWW